MKLANAKHVTMHAKVTWLMPLWKEKQTSDGVKGIEERDQTVNDYMDGKRRPKNPDPLGPPCFLHGGPRGIPATDLSDQYFWAMSLLPHGPQCTSAFWSSITGYGGTCKETSAPGQHDATAVCPHGFPRWDCYCLGFVAGAAYAKHACLNPYLPIWRCQGRAQAHACHAVHFARIPSKTDLAYLNHIVCVHYDASFGCGSCLSAVTSSVQKMKEHIKGMPRVDHSSYAIAGKCARWAFA